jgi:hypothetical protein
MIEVLYMAVELDDDELDKRCERWVQRFTEIAGQPPFGIPCVVRKVEGDLRGRLEATFAETDDVFNDCELWAIRDGEPVLLQKLLVVCQPTNPLMSRLLVVCQPWNPVRSKILVEYPYAKWGASAGMIAVIYHHEPTLIWHEMFHLLGAEECYDVQSPDESAIPTCGHRNCIMQYAPSLDVVGDPPFICDWNVKLIRSKWAEISTEAG